MGRTPCCDKEGLKKGPWTSEEDQKLIDYIQKHGPGSWRTLPKKAGLQRCGKSCRLRWTNYLRPDIKRGKFSFEEEETIIQLHSILGNKWSAIAAKLPGRTDNEIKNYWNTHIRKRLLRLGIDPVTHGPRLDLFDLSSLLNSLQNPSLFNMSPLLNLQTLVNPELLRLANSLASQNAIPNCLTPNYPMHQFVGNPILQNSFDPNTQIVNQIKPSTQNIPSLDGTKVKPKLEQNPPKLSNFEAIQSGFQVNGHFDTEPSFKCNAPDHATLNQSFDNSANSSVFSTPSASSGDPLDSYLTHLINNTSGEDEIESYFSHMVKKLETPAILDVCS